MQGFIQLFNSEISDYLTIGLTLAFCVVTVVIAIERTYYTLSRYFLRDNLKAQTQVSQDIIIELKKMQ
jgi:hypothetical protein